MQLHEIRLLSNYKQFSKGQNFIFGSESMQGIIGTNGSGKSILLELISKIFLESSKQIIQENYRSKIDFEAIYSLRVDFMVSSIINDIDESLKDIENINIRILNIKNRFEMWIHHKSKRFRIENLNYYNVFFPRNIIVYSSGHNQGISDEIISFKLRSLIEKENEQNKKNNAGEIISNYTRDKHNELYYYFDNEISKLAILTFFLYGVINKEKFPLLQKLEIESFSLYFNGFDIYGDYINFDSKVTYLIKEYKELDYTRELDDNGFEKLNFKNINKKINRKNSLLTIFQGLQRLHNYNVYKIKKRMRRKIINSTEGDKKSLIDWSIGNRRVFELLEMVFNNTKAKEKMDLRAFSDGEYQFLQIISILSIFNGGNNLFLLDEPETHFNPSWKSSFISIVKSTINESSQVIFTSHNSEVVTDLKKSSVISMNEGNQIYFQFETFGANPNIISANFFGRKNTISDIAKLQYDRYFYRIEESSNNKELEQLRNEISNNFGDSSERLILLIEIQKRMK